MMYQWLSYGNQPTFSHREFSFTIEPVPGEEIYIRYQSFQGKNELAAAITKRRPVKIDIGAIFSHPPCDKNTVSNFTPEARELVFDIDLTDYDGVRKCGCSGANICGVCWEFMTMAVKVMDEGLREDFGFENIAWFYSGRRGVHCWVCDESARALTDQGRSAVAHYFEVRTVVLFCNYSCWTVRYQSLFCCSLLTFTKTFFCNPQVNLGTEKNKEVDLPYPLHPMLARAYDVLEPMFIENVLPEEGHGLLASVEQWTALLEDLPEVAWKVRDNLLKAWQKEESTPAEKWVQLKKHLQAFNQNKAGDRSKAPKTSSSKDSSRIENWHVEVVFRYTYPRLDINVSKMRNHLLKSPFCVHPKTGRVCVPIRPETVDQFDPFEVPTLPQLMNELDAAGARDDESNKNSPDWYKTSLKSYFEPFENDFLKPLYKDIRRKNRDADEQQAALVGDF